MIFCNKDFETEELSMPFGTMEALILGERGRGRNRVTVPVPKGTKLKQGLNENSIEQTKLGKTRINNEGDGAYAVICTKHGHTRSGSGYVKILKSTPSVKTIEKGWGADGDKGEVGSWDAVILAFEKNHPAWVAIRMAGGCPADFLYWDGVEFHPIKREEIMSWTETLPFTVGTPSHDEWQKV